MLDYEGNTDRFANCGDLDEFDDNRDYDNPFDPWNCDCDDDYDDREW